MPPWPKLPPKAAYLTLNNPSRRNALSLSVLQSLKSQLETFNTSPADGRIRLLPPFRPALLTNLEAAHASPSSPTLTDYAWLVDTAEWTTHRADLPTVLILRSEGPVFSAGHDLSELRKLPPEDVKRTFSLCAEIMTMIRRSPAPVIGAIHGLATAAGCQLALTTDLPVAKAETLFRLPGASIGLPCTSPSTAVGRRLGNSLTYRMLATAEPIRADELPSGTVDVVHGEQAFEERIANLAEQISSKMAAQPQALGKWAFWTQAGFHGGDSGDGYEDAVSWAGRVMALHSRGEDAREGMRAFAEKRPPTWST